MKFLLRVLGTWLIGLMLVLLTMDGTRSLATSHLTYTPIGVLWAQLDPQSLTAVQVFITDHLAPLWAQNIAGALLEWPGWAFAGIFGILALIAGRKKRHSTYADPI